MSARKLADNPIHLDSASGAAVESAITGAQWYEDYVARHAADGEAGRLISQYAFHEDWDMWEMHPLGAEVVLCVGGAMTLWQEFPSGRTEQVALSRGEYAINPPGVWHTADVSKEGAEAVLITAGLGTEHRVRNRAPGGSG